MANEQITLNKKFFEDTGLLGCDAVSLGTGFQCLKNPGNYLLNNTAHHGRHESAETPVGTLSHMRSFVT